MRQSPLTVVVYSSGTTPIIDTGNELKQAQGIKFGTQYPGGLYTSLSLFIQREVIGNWLIKGGQRICIYNGLTMVWEGKISNLENNLAEASQGRTITGTGYWGCLLMQRRIRKPWADTRISEEIWVWITTGAGAFKCDLNRTNQLLFTPKAEAWATDEVVGVTYTAPTGQTVKRVTFDADLQEGAQAWQLELTNGAGTILWSRSSSGTESVDHTLAAPNQIVMLKFSAKANQTPTGDGTYYGKFTNIVVYTETGNIHSDEIVKDVAALDSEISSDTTLVSANTLDLVPFTTDKIGGYAMYADILNEVAKYGDASYNNWASGVRASHYASDGKPILFFEIYPPLSDYDYAVRMDEENLQSTLAISQDFDELYNAITVEYKNVQGQAVYVTPDDDANLKDTTSIASYGQRDALIQIDTTSLSIATSYGRTYLAGHKNPSWRVNGNINLVGYVRGKSGQKVSACEVVAGKRIKIENYLGDLSGTGLTFLITTTSYEEESDKVSIGVGNVDRIEVWLSQLGRTK